MRQLGSGSGRARLRPVPLVERTYVRAGRRRDGVCTDPSTRSQHTTWPSRSGPAGRPCSACVPRRGRAGGHAPGSLPTPRRSAPRAGLFKAVVQAGVSGPGRSGPGPLTSSRRQGPWWSRRTATGPRDSGLQSAKLDGAGVLVRVAANRAEKEERSSRDIKQHVCSRLSVRCCRVHGNIRAGSGRAALRNRTKP